MVPGALAGGIAGLLYLGDGNERDFQLAAPLLALVLFAWLFIVDGLVTALVVERVEPPLRPPRPSTTGYVLIGAATLLTLAAFGIDAGHVLDAA